MTRASVQLIVEVLNHAGVRYMVVGGIAVVAHGYVRATVDIGMLIQLEESNVLTALRALHELGYHPTIPVRAEDFADPAQRRTWIEQKQMKVLKLYSDSHRETNIDVFVDDPSGFEDAYRRMLRFALTDNVDMPVCSYQDLVTLKLQAGRPKDLEDLAKLRQLRGDA